jgi:hypothetical protein
MDHLLGKNMFDQAITDGHIDIPTGQGFDNMEKTVEEYQKNMHNSPALPLSNEEIQRLSK